MAPTFLTESTSLIDCSQSLARGGFYHAGQVCVSVQRIFITKNILDNFIEIFKKDVQKLKIGDPLKKETNVGPLIRPAEVDRVDEWVQESVKNGAELILGGKRLSETEFDKTILLNPKSSDKISQSEIFGPVVCIHTYTDFEKAISIANSVDVSFQASIFTYEITEF